MVHSQEVKHIVLDNICVGERWVSNGGANYCTGLYDIHVRFCSTDRSGSPHYKFNINPNTLSNDYEVWICGDANKYYLIPIKVMIQIYNDVEGYVDSLHPNIRIVSVNAEINTVTYAAGGKSIDLAPYLRRTL